MEKAPLTDFSDFTLLENWIRSPSPDHNVVSKDGTYERALQQSMENTEEYWGQALEDMVASFCPGTVGILGVPVKPDEVIPIDLIQQLILNREASFQPIREVISAMLLNFSKGLSNIFLHPQLQYALTSKLPTAVADKAKNDPRVISACFDLVAKSLVTPVGSGVEWLNEGRLREYRKRLEASDISADLRQELLTLGDRYWKTAFEPSLFTRQFIAMTEGLTEVQQIDLDRIMLLLASNTSVDSAAAWGELLTAIGQGFTSIATLINRQLTNELKYAPLNIQARGEVIQEPISIEIPFFYKSDTIGHQLEGISDQVTQVLRTVLQEAQAGPLQSHLSEQQLQQIIPVLNAAAIQIGQGVQTILEVLIATIARQDCAAATKELLEIIQQHSKLYIKVGLQESEEDFVERFKNAGRLKRYGLHHRVESGDETEFWSEILAKMPKVFATENTLSLLLKLLAPGVESQMKAMRGTESLVLFGASATINRFVAQTISNQVNYYTDPFTLNELLIKKVDLYWSTVPNYLQEPEWIEYQRQLKAMGEVASVNGKYQVSKYALKSAINHCLAKASLPSIPGVKNLIMATALELHGACQNPALTRSLLFHLVERVAERSALDPLSRERQREILNRPLDSLLANKFFSEQNMKKIVAIAIDVLELGRQHLPEDTSRFGKGLLWVGATFASSSTDWVKSLLQRKAQKILGSSAASLVGKTIDKIEESLASSDKGLKATLDRIFYVHTNQ